MGTTSKAIIAAAEQVLAEIIKVTDEFCSQHLNAEYADLCRKLVGKLGRKKNNPLARGEPRIWAAAIVHAIGSVNFLFDKTQTPHMTAAQLCERAGVSKASVATKSQQIRRLLNIIPLEPEFTLPSKIRDNPLAWMIEVDGFILDARTLPEELQAEARRRGLIPDLTTT